MTTYSSERWSARPEHGRSTNARRGQSYFGARNDDKHLKAFVGIVLFVVLGFVLAELHPKAARQPQTPAISGHVTGHAPEKPAN